MKQWLSTYNTEKVGNGLTQDGWLEEYDITKKILE